jgi:protein-S-isoprenylcysteine O-methyltransferase Ste14
MRKEVKIESSKQDKAGIIAPPPLIYGGMFGAGFLAEKLYPTTFLPEAVTTVIGGPLIVLAVLIMALAIRALHRAGTSVDPYKATTALVTDGPFRYTRNPLYLSLTLIYLGATALVNTIWPVVLLPAVLLVMQRGVIAREERYLERKFGKAYLRYKARVRRWL